MPSFTLFLHIHFHFRVLTISAYFPSTYYYSSLHFLLSPISFQFYYEYSPLSNLLSKVAYHSFSLSFSHSYSIFTPFLTPTLFVFSHLPLLPQHLIHLPFLLSIINNLILSHTTFLLFPLSPLFPILTIYPFYSASSSSHIYFPPCFSLSSTFSLTYPSTLPLMVPVLHLPPSSTLLFSSFPPYLSAPHLPTCSPLFLTFLALYLSPSSFTPLYIPPSPSPPVSSGVVPARPLGPPSLAMRVRCCRQAVIS